jgi:hypothetical protein
MARLPRPGNPARDAAGHTYLAGWTIALRPALVGLAALTSLVGGFAVARAAQNVWAVDAHRNLAAAVALQHGTYGSDPEYLYSPLAAALTVPALALPTDIAVVAWLAVKVALLVVGTIVATRGLGGIDRLLVGAAAVAFLPILYDLELGNVTVIVLAAMIAIAWTPDRLGTGIPLGLILATAPKPQLVPLLVWLAVAHRRALVGALATAALATLAGLALTGTGPYAAWVAALRAPAYLTSGDVINLALWSFPPAVAVPGAIAAIGGFLFAIRRGYWPGLLAASCVGLLLAPYTLIYGAGLLLVAAPAATRVSPRAVLALAAIAPVALVLAFPVWIGLALALAVLVPAEWWPPSGPAILEPGPSLATQGGRL